MARPSEHDLTGESHFKTQKNQEMIASSVAVAATTRLRPKFFEGRERDIQDEAELYFATSRRI